MNGEVKVVSSALQNGDVQGVKKPKKEIKEHFDEPPLFQAVCTYICFGLLIIVGHISDFLRKIGLKDSGPTGKLKDDLFKMGLDFERFYMRNIYRKIRDCWNRPICSTPGAHFDVVDRVSDDNYWTFRNLGTTTRCLNLGSYNYLGFAESTGPCADAAFEATHKYGAGCLSVRRDLGTLDVVKDLEKCLARFVGKPACLAFGMGFATNSTNIPALVGKGCLIVSDELNHASLRVGAMISGATIRVFKHNSLKSLEEVLHKAVTQGQPRTHKPWRKILIIVEGVYSMEGSVVKLADVVALKKKYKAYIYLDEAHSIGAIGKTGRGVCDYLGVDPADVDIMMGTFTKSFGGCGGYIAANHEIINHLRQHSHCTTYGTGMSAPVAMQVLTSLKIIMGEDGTNEGQKRILQLADNARYFRKRLYEMKFIVYGNEESPVVPILLYQPGKAAFLAREMLKRKIGVVVVGFPATSLVEARARICLSSSHTREMLDFALKEIDELGDLLLLKMKK